MIKIVLIIVNINKDENKSLISNQFSLIKTIAENGRQFGQDKKNILSLLKIIALSMN
jgi:hypothetical protein